MHEDSSENPQPDLATPPMPREAVEASDHGDGSVSHDSESHGRIAEDHISDRGDLHERNGEDTDALVAHTSQRLLAVNRARTIRRHLKSLGGLLAAVLAIALAIGAAVGAWRWEDVRGYLFAPRDTVTTDEQAPQQPASNAPGG
jgi:hypothetical protein